MSNIFKVYKYLSEDDANQKELAKINPATFYKYLNLFKKTGFDLGRFKTVRRIVTYSSSVKLSDAEMGLIAYLKLLSDSLLSNVKNKLFIKLIDKLLKLTDKTTEEKIEEKFSEMKKVSDTNLYHEKLDAFEKYKDENRNIDILLKNKKRMTLKPNEIVHKNKKIYFTFLDTENNEIKEIDINKIVSLTPKINFDTLNYQPNEIVFELYGRLSKIYLLKEGERIVDFSGDRLVVANGVSDKTTLFKRLLRYDTLCRVRFPKKDAMEFKNLIKKSLENIDCIKDNIL